MATESRNNYNTGTETQLFQKVSDALATFYLRQVPSKIQKMLNANRAKQQAEAAFNARYKGQQIESATAATAAALNNETAEGRSTIKSLIHGELKSSAPQIVGSIPKKREKILRGLEQPHDHSSRQKERQEAQARGKIWQQTRDRLDAACQSES
jgi:hypothetical protein